MIVPSKSYVCIYHRSLLFVLNTYSGKDVMVRLVMQFLILIYLSSYPQIPVMKYMV